MITFNHVSVVGAACTIHPDFVPSMKLMADKALKLGLKIHITSSLRKDTNVKGAIVKPAQMSNHLVGHAIDCNIVEGSKWWNSELLKHPTGVVLEFIEFCGKNNIRWGGRFAAQDPVHFDDGLNVRNPESWKKKFAELHP